MFFQSSISKCLSFLPFGQNMNIHQLVLVYVLAHILSEEWFIKCKNGQDKHSPTSLS